MKYELIKIQTAYNPKGMFFKTGEFDKKENAFKAFDESKDKSTYYHLLFNKETGEFVVRGKRKKVIDKLITSYHNSTENYPAIKKLVSHFKEQQRRISYQVKSLYLKESKGI